MSVCRRTTMVNIGIVASAIRTKKRIVMGQAPMAGSVVSSRGVAQMRARRASGPVTSHALSLVTRDEG